MVWLESLGGRDGDAVRETSDLGARLNSVIHSRKVEPVRVRLVLGSILLLIVCWCGACTGPRGNVEAGPSEGLAVLHDNQTLLRQFYGRQHYFGETEVDLEYGDREPASRYSRPRGARQYQYDETAVDLASPRPEEAESPQEAEAPAAAVPPVREPAPLPGGGR